MDPTANTAAATAVTRPLRDMVLLAADPSRPDGRGRDLPTCSPAQTTGYRSVRRGVRALGDAMRKTLLAALTVLLVSAPAAQADGGHGGGELREYAKGTWASFVAMTDERPACRPTSSTRTARRACRRRRRTSARTCGARSRPRSSASSASTSWSRGCRRRSTTLEGMERHAPAGQYYNWYDHRTGAKLTVWPPTGEPNDPDPVLGRQRLARDRPEDRREQRSRSSRGGPGSSTTR